MPEPRQQTLTERIKARALDLGFIAVGIAEPGLALTHSFYREWLEAGHAGAMSYLERHAPLKADPRRLMEQVRAVVMVTFPYGRNEAPTPEGLQGRVARYAWGRDYHAEVEERLVRLAQGIEAEASHPVGWKAFVDTSPMLEREWAVRAGLGWVGKNAVLINWQHGSWLFLGGLLLDLALDADVPGFAQARPTEGKLEHLLARDGCGACRACLDACPTEAIVADRTVDARRCIAYHTIELKGSIPEEFRSDLGNWVFGCDICQDVCPWNRTRRESGSPPPEAGQAWLDLIELVNISEEAFQAKFGRTALLRTRRRGLARNAAIALGNALAHGSANGASLTHTERADAIRALIHGLEDSEPVVRGAAAWGLARAQEQFGLDAVQRALDSELDATVQHELLRTLSKLRGTVPPPK